MRAGALLQLIQPGDLLAGMLAHEFDFVERFRIAAGIDQQARLFQA